MYIDSYQGRPCQGLVPEHQREYPSACRDLETFEFPVLIAEVCSVCPTSDDLGCVIQTAKKKMLIKIEDLGPGVRRYIIREDYAQT